MDEITCSACGGPADGRQGLPVDTNGRIVHNGYTGEWGGVPACHPCFIVHKAAGPVGLEAHLEATKELRDRLAYYRKAIQEIADASYVAFTAFTS